MSTGKSILIALLIGAAIGVLAGVLTVPQREKGRESQQEQAHGGTVADTGSVSASGGEAEQPPAELYAPDSEEYQAYLGEVAEDKSVQAGSLDLLNVAEETWYYLMDALYPQNAYDKNAFEEAENGQRRYTDTATYTSRCGVDVSEFNGEIDWEQVKAAGYEFAFIRLGFRGYEGGDLFADARFRENLEGARRAGLDVGVYFFAQATDEDEAREEADFVISQLDGAELQLPVIYDPESIPFDEARTDETTGTQFSKNTLAFCRAIEEGGYEAGYYANLKWEVFMLDMAALQEYDVWYAGYESVPKTPYAFSFWQYSDQGEVPGISENTDLDLQLMPVS